MRVNMAEGSMKWQNLNDLYSIISTIAAAKSQQFLLDV